MKRILFFTAIFFAASFCSTAQTVTNGTAGHYNVLTYYNDWGFSSGSMKITTNIPISAVTNTSVYIKGFDGLGDGARIDLAISWQNDGGYFNTTSASSSGATLPDIYLGANSSNMTVIYLANSYMYGVRFEVTAFANGHGELASWYTNWTVTDEDTYDAWERVGYLNRFDNAWANYLGANYFSGSTVYGYNVNSRYLYAMNTLGVGTSSPLGNMQVKGAQGEWDGPTRMYLTNNASLYGRTNLILTGRLDAYNDSWTFGSNARNSIVFATNYAGATGNQGTEKYSIQLEGNSKSLGFLSSDRGTNPTMVLTQDGHVGIGTVNPQAMLSVKGNVLAKEVKVSVAGADWPDYVFDKSYQLRPLTELEAFIKKNKHLPGVLSAKEVDEKGVDIGSSQATILQKVEELTLYIIEQDKKAKQQEERAKQQEERIKQQELANRQQLERLKQLEEKLNKLLADKK